MVEEPPAHRHPGLGLPALGRVLRPAAVGPADPALRQRPGHPGRRRGRRRPARAGRCRSGASLLRSGARALRVPAPSAAPDRPRLGRAGSVREGSGYLRGHGAARGAGPHRLPAGALAGPHLQGRGVPEGDRGDPGARPRGAPRAGRSRGGSASSRASATRPRGSSPRRSPARPRATSSGSRSTRPRPTSTRAGPGAEVRSWLRGDLHMHSDWSDGGSPVERMARTAAELGHEYLAMTDHSPRLTIAHGLEPRATARAARPGRRGSTRSSRRCGSCAASRSTSSRTARWTRRTSCSPSSTSSSRACTRSCG